MQTKHFLLAISFLATLSQKAQTLYSERFNSLSLITGTNITNGANFGYTNLPTGMISINNGNFKADTLSANYPYKAPLQSQQAWLAYKPTPNANTNDTFAVSTSWLLPTGTAQAWMITPLINNIASNSVLTWEAMAPDASNADGYEVYISTSTNSVVTIADFSIKLLTITAENNTWTGRGVSLAAYAGQNVRIAFKNNSTDKYQLWIDDIIVSNISNQYDVAGISNQTYKYALTNTTHSIAATFQNNGYAPITSLTLNYKAGTNATISEVQNFTSPIQYSDKKQLVVSNPFISSVSAYNDLKIWVSSINGQVDQVPSNDTVVSFITVQPSAPAKKVLIEEVTSTNCGFCPDGQEKLKTIASNTNVVVASVHFLDNYDTFSNVGLVAYTGNVSPQENPVGLIDRYYFTDVNSFSVDRLNWNSSILKRQNMIVPATVSITNVSYNSSTREVTATVASNFAGNIKGDYRLNLYVKENNVHGPTGNVSWYQLSYLYNVPTSAYYQIGAVANSSTNPVSYVLNDTEYQQQYLINDMLGSVDGLAGIIPSNGLTAGQTYSTSFTYTLPTATAGEFRYNDFNTYLVATVSEYNADIKQRNILNVTEKKLTTSPESIVGIKEQAKSNFNINLYPNPATDAVVLSYTVKETQPVTISVYNTLGELVLLENTIANSGVTNQVMNVSSLLSGNYSVVVRFKNESVTQKLTIIK